MTISYPTRCFRTTSTMQPLQLLRTRRGAARRGNIDDVTRNDFCFNLSTKHEEHKSRTSVAEKCYRLAPAVIFNVLSRLRTTLATADAY